MAGKLKVNFFVFPWIAFLVSEASLSALKKKKKKKNNNNKVNFVGTLNFSGRKEIFRFKKLLVTLDTSLRLSQIDEAVSRRCKLCKTGE